MSISRYTFIAVTKDNTIDITLNGNDTYIPEYIEALKENRPTYFSVERNRYKIDRFSIVYRECTET